uniref:Uncharacterized protein n=1 Tax=Molossus molossus TaxID=27622 RepID=A0A7J8I7W5_MOLMO|nr:hypothetical protein HJG59_010516 [Molossus molossus]
MVSFFLNLNWLPTFTSQEIARKRLDSWLFLESSRKVSPHWTPCAHGNTRLALVDVHAVIRPGRSRALSSYTSLLPSLYAPSRPALHLSLPSLLQMQVFLPSDWKRGAGSRLGDNQPIADPPPARRPHQLLGMRCKGQAGHPSRLPCPEAESPESGPQSQSQKPPYSSLLFRAVS